MNGEGISSEVINRSNGLLLVINYHRISGGFPWVESMNEPKDRNQADCRLITFLHTGPGVSTGKVLINRSFSIKWIYASVNIPVMGNGGRAILTASDSSIVETGWSMLCIISPSLFTVQPVSFSNHFFLRVAALFILPNQTAKGIVILTFWISKNTLIYFTMHALQRL